MEVFPPKKDTDFEMVKEAALHIASLKPSFMSVTYGAGGSTKGNTIKLASEIQKQYQVPAMAHLTCVCATKESINTALTEMKQAGIENILALRGDIPKDYDGEVFTEFQHASQLVELIKKTGDFCVGGACYPEVHPDSKNKFDDINGIKEKVKAGSEFLTTQMFFDNDIHYNFLPNQTIFYLLNNRIPDHPDKYMCHSFDNAHIYQVHSTFFVPARSRFVLLAFPSLKALLLQISS